MQQSRPSKPLNVVARIIASGSLSFRIGCAGYVHDMNQGVRVPEVVKEPIAQSFAFMCARNESSYIEQFDRHRTFAIDARAIVWFATIRQVVSHASTVYLQVADRPLGIDGSKAVDCLAS